MRTALFLLSALLLAGVALADLTSTNPAQDPFFHPSLVNSLTLGQTVSSTIYNQTGYAEFYYVWIPTYVGEVTYSINVTNGETDECYTYVEAQIATSTFHGEFSFPCYYDGGSYSAMCDDYNFEVSSYLSTDSVTVDIYSDDLYPGRYHYISVYQGYDDYNCDYTLSVVPTFSCANTSVPLYVDYSNTTCTTFYNYTTNGMNLAGTLNDSDSFAVYGVNVPANVSRIWAFLSYPVDNFYFSAQSSYPTINYGQAQSSTSGGYQNSTNNLYNSYVEIEQPEAGWVFFTVWAYSTVSAPQNYNITIYWNYCGSSYAGLGDFSVDVYSPYSYYSIPDCNVPIVQTFNLTTQTAWTFSVPAYNSTIYEEYAAQYASLVVPWGTSGYVNLTCNTTDTTSDSFVVVSKGRLADCYNYDYRFQCQYVGETSYSGEYFYLISQDLYTGGQWGIGACNDNYNTAVTIVISNNGAVAAPVSASPSPAVASASPGQSTGGIPSASPSPGSDNGSSSVSNAVFPAFAVIALAALFSLLF